MRSLGANLPPPLPRPCLASHYPFNLCQNLQEIIDLDKFEAEKYGSRRAVLMPDATLLPPSPSLPKRSPTICVELKPKAGHITRCPTVHPKHASLKHSTSRYQLHQLLKVEEGTVRQSSTYDPLDLFSGDEARMAKAVTDLMAHPQNNLALFVNGKRENLTGQEGADRLDSAADALFGAGAEGGGVPRSRLIAALVAILRQEQVLQGIAAAQKLCEYDIEGVYRLYCHYTGQEPVASPCASVCRTYDLPPHEAAISALLDLPRHEAIRVLRNYCISATAKDCSVMIAMERVDPGPAGTSETPQPLRQGVEFEECGLVHLVPQVLMLRYRVTIVDLDRKSLGKIPKHHDLDRRIMACAQRKFPQGNLQPP